MKIEFNSNNSKGKNNVGQLQVGNFEDMQKMRKKKLPEMEKRIQQILENYNGESMCIIIQREDENGMPDHAEMLMCGTSRMEAQLAMGKALNKASDQALEVVIDSAVQSGDVKAMMTIASTIANMMDKD